MALLCLASLILSPPLPSHALNRKIVLLPVAIYADKPLEHVRRGVASMLASRLYGKGLEIINQDRIETYLSEKEKQGITSEKRAEELIRKLRADCGIFGSITAIGSGYSLDLALVEVGTEDLKRVTRVSKTTEEDQFIPVLSDAANQLRAALEGKGIAQREISRSPVPPKTSPAKDIFSKFEHDKARPPDQEKGITFKPTTEPKPLKPTGKIPLNMAVMSFDMGDLDGDGTVELVAIERAKLHVFKREEKAFVLIDTHKASWGEEFFKVSVGDIDNNGKAEIYVVGLYGMRARTSVFERVGEFRRLRRKTGHIRIIKDPIEKKSLLVFQGSKVNEFFSGPMHYMNYDEKGKLIKGEELPEMRGAQFYTLIRSDLDKDGSIEWLGFGQANLYEQARLHLWGKRGELLWRGEKDLGGTNNAIRVGENTPYGPPPRISFNSRLVFTDIDGDGGKEIVTLLNTPMIKHSQNFKVYIKSRLIAYERQGSGLSPGWITEEIDYCITDMQSYGQSLFLAAHKGKISNIGKKSGLIMWFE